MPAPCFREWSFLARSHCLQTLCTLHTQGCSCQKIHQKHRILPCCIAQHVLPLQICPKSCRHYSSFLSVFPPTWRSLHILLGTWNPCSWSCKLHSKCTVHSCSHQKLWLCNFFLHQTLVLWWSLRLLKLDSMFAFYQEIFSMFQQNLSCDDYLILILCRIKTKYTRLKLNLTFAFHWKESLK